ncbi:M48 family metalloprotease [Sphingomonas endolithica]|uniref:M48 family metalloprotease n=1 Tax=Sphingomonas endolithica TaxID=2972485 RepID=UPI0021B01B7F|nr:M48 family metalloprotease [Sphingomonas sp. ZFBP2030]
MGDESQSPPALEPLAYHRLIVEHLRENEPEIWAWGCSHQTRDEQVQEMRSYLLRETYRIDAAAHPHVHEDCAAVLAKLGLDAPATLYQASDGAMNAALCFVPGEIHLLFHGPVLEKLSRDERIALLGHELAHYRLWSIEDGAFYAATTILDHALAYPGAAPSHVETARLYRLHTELYADRGSAVATGAPDPAIATLVKTMTGLTAVDPQAYLRQAAEAESDARGSQGDTHPEIFLRAQALDKWWRGDAETDAWIEQRIRGPLSIAALDLPRQHEATSITRRFLTRLSADPAADAEATGNLIRRFFPDWRADEEAIEDAALAGRIDGPFRDYLVALSLDVAMADPDGRDAMLTAGARLAASYDGESAFRAALKRDLKMTKAAIERVFSPLKKASA